MDRWFSEWEAEPIRRGRAANLLTDLINERKEDAWERILALIDHARTDDSLLLVGAGPLEDLLTLYAADFIERVEAKAASDSRFRISLSNVWGFSVIEPSLYSRIQGAAQQK